jgi:rRNA maturation RNase YbeY
MSSEAHGRRDQPEITVAHAGLVPEAEAQWLRERLQDLVRAGAPALRRLTVQCVDDRAMIALHARHLHDPTTTDVLTFAHDGEADIAICVDEAARRGEELGHQRRLELLLYCLHGWLHAAGLDDRTPADYAAMHREENRLLRAIGLGELFGAVEP